MSTAADAFWAELPLGRGVELLTRDENGVAALNKPEGVLSHPNEAKDRPRCLFTTHYDAQAECYEWSVPGAQQPHRVWLLNRLDSATSGAILVVADGGLAREIRAQFKRKQVTKIYQALVFGKPSKPVEIWRDVVAVVKKGGRIRAAADAGRVPAESHIKLALDAGVHSLQVGARNALNYSLLRSIGRAISERDTAVLLKHSIHMGPLNEFISAAEYIAAFGNPNVILCPRGTTPTLDGYRNHPDESITPLLKEKTWAPVVVDPSHSVGKASYVPAAALAAVAYGADGLCMEAHVEPTKGIGDDPKQALTPEALKKTIAQAKQLWALRRS